MAKAHRLSMIGVVLVCFATAQGNVTLFASDEAHASTDAAASPLLTDNTTSQSRLSASGDATDLASSFAPQIERLHFPVGDDVLSVKPLLGAAPFTFHLDPSPSPALGAQIYQGRPYKINRNGSIAALMIGAAATITGAAILVYANRPDCSINEFEGGCGYGTKVIGGSVLAGGIVGLFLGALTWR
ncbi:MAG TPA: hypothetical protein VLV86_12495 [Vicinamibacterales bacterium]|nr:hypothetical protein [Vicinamibacterales bacterium]